VPDPRGELAVDVRGLTRRFGAVTALDGVDLAIPRGAVFGLLGPNGAGKTTTVRILNGVLEPTRVERLRVLGCTLPDGAAAVRPQVGVQTDTNLYERLSARENLAVYGRLYGMGDRDAGRRADELLEMFGLRTRATERVEKYSKGMKQKLLIARALVGSPVLVYLDEPTAGLDPGASHELMRYITRVSREAQTTFFITSHRLDEMEDVCTHVAVLAGGVVRACGSPAQVARAAVPRSQVRVTPAPHAVVAPSDLMALPGVLGVTPDRDGLLVDLGSLADVPAFIRAAAALPVDLLGIAEEASTLEEAYLVLVGEENAGGEAR
jgi:ABC-2 type transport system ATP-binding protein